MQHLLVAAGFHNFESAYLRTITEAPEVEHVHEHVFHET